VIFGRDLQFISRFARTLLLFRRFETRFAFEIEIAMGPPRVRPAERDGPRRCAEEEEGWSATAERVVIRSEVGGDKLSPLKARGRPEGTRRGCATGF
jgi:hypothetical protein